MKQPEPEAQNHFSIAETSFQWGENGISMGAILDNGSDTKKSLFIDLNSLKNHVLVCGVTGSSKTNTCFHLLQQLWRHQIPFLVIASAKSEYRQLMLESEVFKGSGRVYTLGNETVAPFRMNPFEILNGVKVQTHIDALLSIFDARDKSFLAATVLLFLSQYRRVQGLNDSLQHVLLIEDAHLLLKKEFTIHGNNNQGGAFAQIFVDTLSQAGSYGEGIIVSSQTPVALIPEVFSLL